MAGRYTGREVPTGTVTFLFTDVEGSTGSWDRQPVAMDARLRFHDDTVRAVVDVHGGYVFNTAGDSFAVAFATAAHAVQTAVEIQEALEADHWSGGVPLRVRMGLHTGHAFERDGDYFGPVVNRAARIMAAAHGGQVVCSGVTADLARSEVPTEVEFRSLGEFRLRDLLSPEHLFQVCTPALASSFPPLRTLEEDRHNLPAQRTRLIGRDDDVARVTQLVREHRLVTLTGIGGCGKTRLALAVAAELSGEFGDGAFLVELAPVVDPDRVASVVGEMLRLRVDSHQSGASRRSAIVSLAARQDVLIVLDNCEHLLDAVGEFVDEVLSAGTRARVLATSRESLGVEGERNYGVRSLSLGDGDIGGPAVELYVERAAENADALVVTPDEWPVIVEICRHLDGLPLAIELAAAQTIMLSHRELLAQLNRRFELLIGGRTRRRQRQQTLQAVMDWSWGLLSSDERTLLAGLSTFSGGWTLEAADGVCGDLVDGRVVQLLRSLLSKSLVERVVAGTSTRYRLLETVRLYAQQRLYERGHAEALRSAHCRWFVGWVEAMPEDERILSITSISRLAADFDNVTSAIDWALDRDPNAAGRLLSSCTGMALGGFGATDVLHWAAVLLERELEAEVRARVLLAGAYAAITGGAHDRIIPWAAEAADLARETDSPFVLTLASIWLAAPRMVPQPELAEQFMNEAGAAAVVTQSRLCQGFVESWSLIQAMCTGRVESIDVHPQDANRFGGRESVAWSGAVHVGCVAAAEQQRLDDALALAAEISPDDPGPPSRPGYELMATALAGRPDQARRMAASFIEIVDRWSDVLWHAELVLALGVCHMHENNPAVALTYFQTAKRAPMAYPFWYELTRQYANRARNLLIDGDIAPKQPSRSLTVEAILDRELRTSRR